MGTCIFDTGMTENFETLPILIVHQEQCHTVVHENVTSREQLAIALVIGEGQRRLIDHAQESSRTTSMLNVGPSGFAHRAQVETLSCRNKLDLRFAEWIAFRRVGDSCRTAIILLLCTAYRVRHRQI